MDSELQAKIERLQRARADIAAIIRESAPADSPAGFASVAARLSEPDNSIIHIYARLYDADALADVRRMVDVDADVAAVGAEITALPPDADEEVRRVLAERLAPALAKNLIDYPWLRDPARRFSRNPRVAREAFIAAVGELYNSAQRDVLARSGALAQDRVRAATPEQPPPA